MTDLLVLSDLAELDVVMKRFPDLLTRAHPVTGSLVVAAELERLGIPFSDELSYLEPQEIAHSLNLAYQLSAQWWNEELADMQMLGFSLAQTARQEWALPFELCLNAGIAYRRLFAAKSVERIYGFFLPGLALCRTGPAPAFQPATSVTQAVILWLAHRAGIPVSDLRPYSPFVPDVRQWRPRLTVEDLKSSTLMGSNQSDRGPADETTRFVALWTTGLWAQEIAELERGFAGLPGWKLIKVSKRVLTLGESKTQKRERDQIEKKLDWAWQKYESSLTDYAGSYPEIFSNPHLRFQFARIFSEMRLAAQLGLSFARLLDSMNPSLVVFGHDAFTLERTLVQVARRKAIPTVGLVHGGLQPMYGRIGIVGDVDHVMVWNQQDIEDLTRFDVSENRLCLVGSLRFDITDRSFTFRNSDQSDARKAQARDSLKIHRNHPMILLLTAPTNISVAQPGAEPARHRQTWRELVVLAEGRPDLTFAIKPHPAYDFVEFYRYLCQAGPPNLVLLAPNSLGVALLACDVAVLVNYCSTVALEAMQAGVPVVFVRTAIYQTEMHKDPLEERGAVNVTSVAELEISVDRLLRDRAFRQNVIDDAELLVRSLVGEQPNSALKRLMTEFEKITTTADDNPAPVTTGLGESNVEAILDQMRRLLVSNDLPQFLSKTEELARIAKRTSSEEKDRFEDILWGMAFTVGYSISDPKELKKVVQVCYGQLWDELGLCRAVSSEVVIRAYLVAIMHSIDFGKFDRARSLLWQALTQVPGVALRTRMFWEYLAKSLVGRNRYAMLLVNGIDRLRLISTRLIAPAHITSRIKHLWPA